MKSRDSQNKFNFFLIYIYIYFIIVYDYYFVLLLVKNIKLSVKDSPYQYNLDYNRTGVKKISVILKRI